MSLEKSIKSGKEHRRPYYGSKSFDPSCQRGDCAACKENKLHSTKKRIMKAKVNDG